MKKYALLLILSIAMSYYQDPTLMGTSPLSLSTGGVYGVRADGASAVFNHPESLFFTKKYSVRTFTTSYYSDINYTAVAGSVREGNIVYGVGYAGVQIADLNSTYLNPQGVVCEGGGIPYSNDVFVAGVSYSKDAKGAVGATIKYYHSNIQANNAGGFDMAVGGFYYVTPLIKVIVNADNILSFTKPIGWSSGLREASPFAMTGGVSYSDDKVWVSSAMTFTCVDGVWQDFWNIGATYRFFNVMDVFMCDVSGSFFRDFSHPQLSFATGLSVTYSGVKMNYAFVPSTFYEGGYRHYVGVGIDL